MGVVGMIHVGLALAALASGAVILGAPQGTLLHKRLGYVYVAAMLGLNGSAFLMHRLLGTFGPFHVLALVSLGTLFMAVMPLFTRHRGWLLHHYAWVCWSYVGLVAALVAEVGVRLPGLESHRLLWLAVIIGGSMGVTAAGGYLMERNRKRLLGRIAAGKRAQPYRAEERMLP